ncbi:MAG: glycyl-radical enzyme activating protein [Oscillospiraceae bacterium]|nr:glycyl-radical enzyme activating protein [Oscillospiraceae bacterium]
MKGCPLDCLWCHNPESHEKRPEIAYYPSKCLYCGACVAPCKEKLHGLDIGQHSFMRDSCARCGKCTQACPTGALEIIGREATVAEVLEEVKKDEAFYRNSGGGITLSGGEPFFQPEFAIALLSHAKSEGLHTCVETCGAAAYEILDKAAKFIDVFLCDVKETDPLRHKEFTGVTNETILENYQRLDASGAKIVLRCPIIPGLNDNEAHFIKLCELAGRLLNIDHIDIEPYHPLGISKAEAIGKIARHADASITPIDMVAEWVEFMKRHTVVPVFAS